MKNFLIIIKEYLMQSDTLRALARGLCIFCSGAFLGALLPKRFKKSIQSLAVLGITLSSLPLCRQMLHDFLKKPYSREL